LNGEDALPLSTGIEPPRSACAQSLAEAFASFTGAAASLEKSYTQLEQEVERLRHELEERNGELLRSLEEKDRLRRSLHRVLEGLPCGVLVLDREGAVTSSNPAARVLLSQPHSVASGTLQLEGQFRRLLEEAVSHPEPSEWEIAGDSHEMRWLRVHSALLEPERSRVVILQDCTEARKAAAEHERRQRERALAEMTVLLAHEVRNPLGSLELFAGLLAESGLSPEHREWLDHIQGGLRLLAATVNNVFQFHGPPSAVRVPTDLGLLLTWGRDFLRPLARPAGVRLVLVNQLEGVRTEADRHGLEQVLLNLSLNALRFMPQGGTLQLRGRVERKDQGAAAVLEVADTGPGIPGEQRAAIFEPGFSSHAGSPGLGLAVCRTIVEQHGGTIRVAEPEGPGATLVVELPLGELA